MGINSGFKRATLPFILSILDTSAEELHKQGIEAQELVTIYNDYIYRLNELEDIGLLLANTLKRQKDVHAVRYRVKEPLHLLKKILRKKKEYPHRNFTAANYLEFINDLIGVRLLHLYKESWQGIGEHIQQLWELKREPYAYLKSKDTVEAKQFEALKYKVLINLKGYKAEHFIVRVKPNKQQYFAEIQVKTLFEEGWSEIDHCIRYPVQEPSELLNRLLWLLNQFTTNADQVATQIQALSNELHTYTNTAPASASVTIAQLHAHINKLPVDEQEKQYLYTCLARLVGK
ncbi:RelA/SpoT domain-containing protein [uncultured Pontibacter sp.]|uniref:RelA/SpoT domain-containing protein n=1 Tax=uncultured Pontibacter sp. TaxID=453356 RepID=UPI00262D2413|nr:RelA/SpoT domain-containing protein [uncultured Pontibacter sp.]